MLNVAHQIGFYRSFVDTTPAISPSAGLPLERQQTISICFLNSEHYKGFNPLFQLGQTSEEN
jgi:hypothetical protein